MQNYQELMKQRKAFMTSIREFYKGKKEVLGEIHEIIQTSWGSDKPPGICNPYFTEGAAGYWRILPFKKPSIISCLFNKTNGCLPACINLYSGKFESCSDLMLLEYSVEGFMDPEKTLFALREQVKYQD